MQNSQSTMCCVAIRYFYYFSNMANDPNGFILTHFKNKNWLYNMLEGVLQS